MSSPAIKQEKTSGLLRWLLGVDGAYEVICGAACFVASGPLAGAFGLKEPGIVRAAGVGLIGVGLGIGLLAAPKNTDRRAATVIAAANSLSSLALLSLLAVKWLPVNSTGQLIAGTVGVDLAILARLEWWGLGQD